RPDIGPLVEPGTYTVELTVDGQKRTEKVLVRLEPRVAQEQFHAEMKKVYGSVYVNPTPKELSDQTRFALNLRDDISSVAQTVEELRGVRKQLTARAELL